MGKKGKESGKVMEDSSPLLLTGTWPVLGLSVSQPCPREVLSREGVQNQHPAGFLFWRGMRWGASQEPLSLYHHNPGCAFCLSSVF